MLKHKLMYMLIEYYGSEEAVPEEAKQLIQDAQDTFTKVGSGSVLSVEGVALLLFLHRDDPGMAAAKTAGEKRDHEDELIDEALKREKNSKPEPPVDTRITEKADMRLPD